MNRSHVAVAALLLLLATAPVFPQHLTVTTLAGSDGGEGFVDATGTASRFHMPVGLAADAAGNVYVADSTGHTIRKMTPAGVVTTLAGLAGVSGSSNGRGAAARFFEPRAVALDGSGNVFVADGGNGSIRRISPAGVVTTFATGFAYPSGVVVDALGTVYVSDTLNHAIRKVTATGTITTFATEITFPNRLALDSSNHLFCAGSGSLHKISPEGVKTLLPTSANGGVAVDVAGNAYVSEYNTSRIVKVSPSGQVTSFAGLSGAQGSADGTGGSARFLYPQGVALAPGGLLYVADAVNMNIRKITVSDAVVTTVAGKHAEYGSTDGPAAGSRFFYPSDAAVDSLGNVFIADQYNRTIRKITPAGVVSTFAGTPGTFGSDDGTGAAARFLLPIGIAADASDNLFVADYDNHTIRKITPAGVVTTLAGMAGMSGLVNASGTSARFHSPNSIAVHPSGDLYVAEWVNETIRKVTQAGVVTTLTATPGLPSGIDVDAAGDLYVTDYENHTLLKITVPGAVVSIVAGESGVVGSSDGTGPAAHFYAPSDVAVEGGMMYVFDNNALLRKVTPAGEVTTVAGRGGLPSGRISGNVSGTGPIAHFMGGGGIVGDGDGNLYITDLRAENIRHARLPGIDDIATTTTPAPAVNTVIQLDTAPMTATSWEWSVIRRPAGSTAQLSSASIPNPTFTPDIADTFTLLLRASSAAGVRYSTLDVTPTGCDPIATIVASLAGAAEACISAAGGTASVAVSGGETLSYQWGYRTTPGGSITTIGGANASAYAIQGADFGSVGTKYLVVTVTPSCGDPLVSNPIAVTITASPVATLQASSGVFANTSGNTATAGDAGSGATYNWIITNGTINSGQGTSAIQYTSGASGTVGLQLEVTKNGCMSAASKNVPILTRRPGATMLFTVTPCRVIDTRNPVGPYGGPAPSAGVVRRVQISGVCGIPAGAKAISMNVTAVGATWNGWLTLFPAGAPLPGSSTMNYRAGKNRAGNAVVPLSLTGELDIYNSGPDPVHFIVDVNGYFQ